MKHTTKYVGLDVHRATTVAVVRDDGGHVLARSVVATEATAVLEFVRGMRGAVHMAFEEGTQVQWLHDLLRPHAPASHGRPARGLPRQSASQNRSTAPTYVRRQAIGSLRANSAAGRLSPRPRPEYGGGTGARPRTRERRR